MAQKYIDEDRCLELASKLLEKIANDRDFVLLTNVEVMYILALTIALNAYRHANRKEEEK